MFADDLPVMFSDFAVAATWSPTVGIEHAAEVILDKPDEVILGGNVLAGNTQMIFREDQFVGIDEGDVVTIGSDSWLLRETPRQSADGRVMTVSVVRQ